MGERLELLLDRGSPFLELSPLSGWGTEYPVGADSSPVLAWWTESNQPSSETTSSERRRPNCGDRKNIDHALEISRLNNLPYIQFVGSAGGDLPGTDDADAEMRRNMDHFAESAACSTTSLAS